MPGSRLHITLRRAVESGVAVPFSFTLPGEDPSILNRCLLLPCWKGLLALSEMVLVKAFSGHCETSRWFVVSSSGQWCRGVTLCEQLVAAQSRLYLGNLQLSSPHPHILPTDEATLNWHAEDCKTNTPHKSPKPSPPERCTVIYRLKLSQVIIGCQRLGLCRYYLNSWWSASQDADGNSIVTPG